MHIIIDKSLAAQYHSFAAELSIKIRVPSMILRGRGSELNITIMLSALNSVSGVSKEGSSYQGIARPYHSN